MVNHLQNHFMQIYKSASALSREIIEKEEKYM